MDIKKLDVFCKVVELNSFTKAGLGISILSARSLAEDVQGGKLTAIPLEQGCHRKTHLSHPTKKSRAFTGGLSLD